MSPPFRLPSIDGLRAFESAARLGTFERAAEALDITASAVSKRVATVEDLLGTALLNRAGRALTLTPAGKEYLVQVSTALGLLSAMPLHQRAQQQARRLRVSAPPTFAREILVPQLESFSRAHPEVELEVVLSIPFLDVSGTEADVEVRHGDSEAAGGTPLMHDVVLPMAAPTLLARLPALREPADLALAPLLRTPLEPWMPWFRAAGLDWPEPTQGPRLIDLGLTLEAAVSGQGVALMRPSLAQRWIGYGALQPLFDLSVQPATAYHVLPHAPGEAASAFVDWLAATSARVAHEGLQAVSDALSGRT